MKNLSLLVASSAVLLTCFTESSHALSFLNPNVKEIKNVNNSKLSDALVEFKNKYEELVSQLTTENLEKDETIKSMQKKYYDETTNLKNKISHLHNVIKQQQDSINKQNVELQKYKSIVDQNQDMSNKISHLNNVIKQQQDSINKQNVELQKYKSIVDQNQDMSDEYENEQARDMRESAKQNFLQKWLTEPVSESNRRHEKKMKQMEQERMENIRNGLGEFHNVRDISPNNPYYNTYLQARKMENQAKEMLQKAWKSRTGDKPNDLTGRGGKSYW